MWSFCARSVLREYGWQFVRRVALPHPVRTARAILDASPLDDSGAALSVPAGLEAARVGGPGSIVGLGFCLKPLSPPCPSGRPNHDCLFLERLSGTEGARVPAACRPCAIREIGVAALDAGAGVYIMTSACDILLDVFEPALRRRAFSSGLFLLCGYSVRPFAAGLLAAGIRSRLVPFERGDCCDYRTWLLADRGIKDEQTAIAEPTHQEVIRMLAAAQEASAHGGAGGSSAPAAGTRVVRRGHVLYPRDAGLTVEQPQATAATLTRPRGRDA
jgi:hypothetical protein